MTTTSVEPDPEASYLVYQEPIHGAERLLFVKDRILAWFGVQLGCIVQAKDCSFEVTESFVTGKIFLASHQALRLRTKHHYSGAVDRPIKVIDQAAREEHYRSILAYKDVSELFLADYDIGKAVPERTYLLSWRFTDVPDNFESLPFYRDALRIFEREFEKRSRDQYESINALSPGDYELALGEDVSGFHGGHTPTEALCWKTSYTFAHGFKVVRRKGTGRTLKASAVLPPDLLNDERGYNFNVRQAVYDKLNADLDKQYERLTKESLWGRGAELYCRAEEPVINVAPRLMSGLAFGPDGLPIAAVYKEDATVIIKREYFAEPMRLEEAA